MHATFTNLGPTPVPIGTTQPPAWVNPLEPSAPYEVDGEDFTVVSVGDNPTFREEVAEVFDLIEYLGELLTDWFGSGPDEAKEAGAEFVPVVVVNIHNEGENALRVILGDNTNDEELQPGEARDFSAPRYIEVRELGV